jgi:hypothetical protein
MMVGRHPMSTSTMRIPFCMMAVPNHPAMAGKLK